MEFDDHGIFYRVQTNHDVMFFEETLQIAYVLCIYNFICIVQQPLHQVNYSNTS